MRSLLDRFIYSEDALIKFLEDNHALRVPQMAHYELLRTEMLPENYEIDPLVEDPSIASKDVNIYRG